MAVTPAQHLRSLLGESIPVGGTEADSLFTDEWIDYFLAEGDGEVNKGAYYGWISKAAHYANLVDTTEGSSKRAMSSLHEKALKQIEHFGIVSGLISTEGETRVRTRIGKIVRS